MGQLGAVYRTTLAALSLIVLQPGLTEAAESKGPVTDEIGVLVIPKGQPIQIGAFWVTAGPDATLGIDQKRAAEVAIQDLGGELAGHPVRLIVEDSGCAAETAQAAARKLAANKSIAIVLGPSCSSEAVAGVPILWNAGLVSIGTSTTAPALTDPQRNREYQGFARTVYNDIDAGGADAKWMYDVLGARRVVTIHDGTAYPRQLVEEMAKNFQKLGGKIVSGEAVAPTDLDMRPPLTRIVQQKPDAVYMPIFVAAAAQIIRQSKGVPGLEKTPLIGSGGLMAPDLIKAAGPSVVGFLITYPDVSPEALGSGYPKFVEKYKAKYGEAPVSGFHANAYDATVLAFKAITRAAVTQDGTTFIGRKALRDAVLSTEFDGISGRIACDPNGQCAQLKSAVFEYTGSDPNSFAIGVNPKKIYP